MWAREHLQDNEGASAFGRFCNVKKVNRNKEIWVLKKRLQCWVISKKYFASH